MTGNESVEGLRVDSSNGKETEERKQQSIFPGKNGIQPEKDDEDEEEGRADSTLHSAESQQLPSENSEQSLSGVRLTEVKLQTLGGTATGSTTEAQLKEQTDAHERGSVALPAIQVDQAQSQSKDQLSVSPTSLSEPSPTLITQFISSALRPKIPDHRPSPPKLSSLCMSEKDRKIHSNGKTVTPGSVAKRTSADGYNWRKYGQKQVKSPTGSRSYYRCAHSECSAKKVECCNQLGQVIEVVYRSHHSHDPPKVISSKESKLAPSTSPMIKNCVTEPIRTLIDVGPSPTSREPVSSKELVQLTPSSPERKEKNACSPIDNSGDNRKEGHVNKLEPKRRVKKEDLTSSDTETKPGKKLKLVVRAEGNLGISGDGYRWRKYGQKMVKGNSNPRNYYRCTSAGCPVRKQIESALDDVNDMLITYKGVHDHDMPVPKKWHGPPSGPLVAAAVPTSSMNNLKHKKETKEKQISSTQGPTDKEGELNRNANDLRVDKAIESRLDS